MTLRDGVGNISEVVIQKREGERFDTFYPLKSLGVVTCK